MDIGTLPRNLTIRTGQTVRLQFGDIEPFIRDTAAGIEQTEEDMALPLSQKSWAHSKRRFMYSTPNLPHPAAPERASTADMLEGVRSALDAINRDGRRFQTIPDWIDLFKELESTEQGISQCHQCRRYIVTEGDGHESEPPGRELLAEWNLIFLL